MLVREGVYGWRMVLSLHRSNIQPWGREGDDWVMERQAGGKKTAEVVRICLTHLMHCL